jgi:hypothetical protein
MGNKFTVGGPAEITKVDRPRPEGLDRLERAPEKPKGFIPSKPQFNGLSSQAAQSLANGNRDERTLGGSTSGGGFLKLQTEKSATDLQAKSQASRALFEQHTVGTPAQSYASARAALDAFFLEAKNVSPAELTKLVASKPELLDASIDFLSYRFTPVGFAEVGRDPDAKQATSVALRLVQEMDEPRRARFLETVVFNVAHPANHQALWPAVVNAVPSAQLETALLEKAASTNELHAMNAFALPFHVYGRKPGYELGVGARKQLVLRAEARQANPSTNLLVRQSLEDFALPSNL